MRRARLHFRRLSAMFRFFRDCPVARNRPRSSAIMSAHLDPLILQKLQAFAKRRRKLIILRGVCAAVAMLLATMMIVALIDKLFVLEDWARWTLSALAYTAVIIAEWRACLRLLLHTPDPRRIARLIEHAEPRLREDLLSAVELGQTEAAFDSAQFRELVQQDVAARMEGLNIDRLLPVQLLRRSLILAGIVVAICLAVFAATGFQFGTLLMRAMLPMANLARVSKVKVSVVAPAPADMTVPQGDSEPVIVDIAGQRVNKAVLETFTKSGGREVVQMSATGADRFTASVQVGREDVEYRIRAGDAITRKFKLRAAARPHAVRFHKTYTFPAYTQLAPKMAVEESGDLAAIEGTEAEVQIETDQPVKVAELRLEQGKANTAIPLTPAANGRLAAKVPMHGSGIYRVHLVAAETGFENKFSPEYEVRAEPDLVPLVELELPKQDLIVPANEIVEFAANVSDDLSVAKLELHVRINDGKWIAQPVAVQPGAKFRAEHRWDLFAQAVKAGDTITAKLVAFDLKKNRGESRPVQLTITSAGFETRRLQTLERMRQLFDAIAVLKVAGDTLEKRGAETREQFERLPEGDPQRRQAVIGLAGALEDFERKIADTLTLLQTTARHAAPGHETGDIVMLGRLLARADAGAARIARSLLDVVAADPAAPFARDLVRETAEACARSAQRSRVAEDAYRAFLVCEEIDVLAENSQVVAREQERITELARATGADEARWAQLTTRMRVVLAEMRTVEGLLTAMHGRAERWAGDRLRRIQRKLEEQRTAMDKALAEAQPARLLKPTEELAKTVSDLRRSALDLRRDFAHPPVRSFSQMREEAQPTWSNLEKLRQELEVILRNEKLPAETRAALAKARWDSKSAIFKTHGDVEEARPDSDSYFVSDVRATTLTLDVLRDTALGATPVAGWEKSAPQFAALDRAFRILEAGHNLAELHAGLGNLAVAERWEFAALRSRTTSPRDWEWLQNRLQQAPDELGKAVQTAEEPTRQIVQQAQKILWEAQPGKFAPGRALDREMRDRFRIERDPERVPGAVEQVAAQVKLALDLLRQPMDDARKLLAQISPKLSEMMAQLAKEADELKKESAEQAEKTAEKQPEQSKADAQKQLAAQQELNDKVDALKDAIRSEANKQDLVQAGGRERARDADDALAMLKEPPPRAEQALSDAAQAQRASEQKDALESAALEQQKLADALSQLAQHFEALEKGENADKTRMALREAENALGVKEALDQQYARAEQMQQLASSSPEEMLKQLEQALPKNPLMQQELSGIAKDTLDQAGDKLQQASNQEKQVAQQLAAADTARSQQQAAQKAAEAARQAAEAAREADRLATAAEKRGEQMQNSALDNKADAAADTAVEAAQAADQAAAAAQQAAASSAQQPQQAMQSAQQAAQKAGEAAQKAQQSMAQAKEAQAIAQQAAQQGGENQASNQQAAQEAAQAMQAAANASQAAQAAQAAAQEAAQAAQAMAQTSPPPAQQPATPQSAQSPMPSQQNPALAQAAQQQAPIAQAATQAGEEISRAGRHEERLQNMQAGAQLQQLGAEVKETAAAEVAQAQQALATAQNAEQAKAPVNAASSELASELAQLNQARNGQQAAAPMTAASPQAQPPQSTSSQAAPPQNPAGQQAEAASPASQQNPAAQPGQTPPGEQMAQAPSGQPAAQPQQPPGGDPAQGSPQPSSPAQMAGGPPPTPQEQVWMARTLDALDAALHADASSQSAQSQPSQAGQPAQSQGQSGQPQSSQAASDAQAQAQQAMAAAAQAAAQAMRAQRSESAAEMQAGEIAEGGEQAASKGGVQANAGTRANGALPDARTAKSGDWGKLPKQVAEQLSQGQRESVAAEYRNQVETYYRVIAERAKKP
jgi:hypothetical protein